MGSKYNLSIEDFSLKTDPASCKNPNPALKDGRRARRGERIGIVGSKLSAGL